MRVKMSKVVKILLCVLSALLCISIAFNVYCGCKLSQKKQEAPKTEQTVDDSKESEKEDEVKDKTKTSQTSTKSTSKNAKSGKNKDNNN
jgi:cell division protein FtsL